MELIPKQQPEPDHRNDGTRYGYGSSQYGYGAPSGYGYGYSQSGETVIRRSIHDYLLILRERLWYIVVAFIVVLSSVLLFTYSQRPIFQSTSSVQIFRREPMLLQGQPVLDSEVRSAEDLNTQVNILKSTAIVNLVDSRLSATDREQFLAPYIRPGHPTPSAEAFLTKNRDIVPQRLSLIIDIQYNHPNREIAAKVANLFADEYIAYNSHIQADESIKAVEELSERADDQRKKVNDIANALQTYRERNHMVSLDQRKDIVTDNLKSFNTYVTQASNALQEAQIRWTQILETRKSGGNLIDLPFIASVPIVAQLEQQIAAQKITVAQLGQRYRAKHPAMIEALDSLREAQNQLQRAIDTTASQIESAYQSALQSYSQAQSALATQEADSLKLDHAAVDYSNMERDYDINEKLLEQILSRMHETSVSGTIESQSGRILDRATPAMRPISPDYRLNLGLGVVGGLGIGLALAFFVAYMDDRIKSAFDIETVVGLPILGIVPEVKKLGQAEDMHATIANQEDREATEAFASLYSTLQLKDETKKAQCLLVTSTVAGEGKTFITSHLAETFAGHGERVVIVDCDLRRPAVHRVFHIENLKGVIDICVGEAKLDEVIVRQVRPNLDVVPTGGRSKNPAQNLSTKSFAVMLSELRKRYDRVFVDTPPVAIVSDALIVLPLVDGSLYSIYFNKVKRKAAQYCAQRLLESNVPNFGAILNGLKKGVANYYYSHYYHKSYKAYYVAAKDDRADPESEKLRD